MPFDPLTLSPHAWFRGDLGTYQDLGVTVASADNDPVRQWSDQSGNGRNFSNAGSTVRPLLKLGILNGQPILRFDGVNDVFTSAAAISNFITNSAFVFYGVVAIIDSTSTSSDASLNAMVWGDKNRNIQFLVRFLKLGYKFPLLIQKHRGR